MGKSIFKNFIYKTVLSVFNIAVPLFLGAYAIKKLGEEKIGMHYNAESMYSMFLIFASFGIYNYGLREVSKIRDNKEKLKQFFSSIFIIGLITNLIALSGFIIYINLCKDNNSQQIIVFYIFCFILFCNVFFVEWINEALEKYDFITIKSIIVKITYIFLLLTFVKTSKDLIIYSVLYSVQVFLNNIISFIAIKREIGFTFNGLCFLKHIKPLIASMLMVGVAYLYTGIDKILIGNFLGSSYLPSYAIPQGIVNMIYTLIASIVFVTTPRISYILGKNDEKMYEKMLSKVIRCMCIFMFPAVIGLYLLHSEIIMIYTSGKVIDGIPVMGVFTLYMLSLALEAIVTQQVLYVKRKEKIILYFIALCGVINILFKGVLILFGIFSPLTASITTCIVNYLLFFIEYMYARNILKVNIKFLDIKTIRYILISLIFIPIAFTIKKFINDNIIFSMLTVITCSFYYVGVLFLIKDEVVLSILKKLKFC